MPKYLLIFCVSLLLCSCSGSDEAVSMQSLDGVWNKKQELNFEVQVEDPQTPKNIVLVVRNNNEYPYSNLYVMASVKDARSHILRTDTLNYMLAKTNGEWLGNGFGETKEMQLQYQNGLVFPGKGKYTISIRQGMRANPLVGIEDVGIRLENTK